jgi:hypothetical protein
MHGNKGAARRFGFEEIGTTNAVVDGTATYQTSPPSPYSLVPTDGLAPTGSVADAGRWPERAGVFHRGTIDPIKQPGVETSEPRRHAVQRRRRSLSIADASRLRGLRAIPAS